MTRQGRRTQGKRSQKVSEIPGDTSQTTEAKTTESNRSNKQINESVNPASLGDKSPLRSPKSKQRRVTEENAPNKGKDSIPDPSTLEVGEGKEKDEGNKSMEAISRPSVADTLAQTINPHEVQKQKTPTRSGGGKKSKKVQNTVIAGVKLFPSDLDEELMSSEEEGDHHYDQKRSSRDRYRGNSTWTEDSSSTDSSVERSRAKRRKKKRKQKRRKRSRSRSRRRSRSRSRSRTRSRSRAKSKGSTSNRTSVSDEVKKLVADEMAAMRQQMTQFMKENVAKTSTEEKTTGTPKIKSPSAGSLYTPLVPRLSEARPDQVVEFVTDAVENFSVGKQDDKGKRTSTSSYWGDKAKGAAEEAILESERFRGAVQQPQGKIPNDNQLEPHKPLVDEDDTFFHLTCHVDEEITKKAEKGEFVDLVKLTSKYLKISAEEEQAYKMVNRNGVSCWVPITDSDCKINNIKRWDEAFRVYAAIYCRANPNRAGEIWQYIYTIHQAASIFSWENVAAYDYTFRHLMARCPLRNWGKTYTQMWNLHLCAPAGKVMSANKPHGSSSSGKSGDWRDKCCWRYNKNHCKYGKECRFEHRCTYCGAFGHPSKNCHKKTGSGSKRNEQKPQAPAGSGQGGTVPNSA